MDLSTREGRRQQGERIKQAAREAGLSLDELARRIGCSRALIFQYASGASLIQTDRLQQIALIVGRPLPWFFIDSASLLDSETTDSAGNSDESLDKSEERTLQQAALDASLLQEREQLEQDRNRFTAERTRYEQRRLQEDVTHLETLLSAYSSPVDFRKVVECCQQLQTLLTREEDIERLAAVLFQQGNALLQLQEWGAAKERLHQAGTLYRQVGKTVAARDCMQSLGHANLMLGRVEEAMQQFEFVAAGEDWANRWQGTLSVGAAHELLGNYTAAIAAFEQALQIVEERDTGSPETLGAVEVARLYIEANWANLELDFGDYESARERAQRCTRIAQRRGIQDQYLEALLTGGVASLHRLELRDALKSVQQALDVAGLAGDQQHTSLALACLSLCEAARHRPEEAIVAGKEALALALRCSALRAEVLAQRALCEAYLCATNPSEALYHAQQGLATATNMRLHLPQAQFEVLRARALTIAGQLPEAIAAAERALRIASELQVRPVQRECHLLLARNAYDRQEWDEAHRHAERARDLADTLLSALPEWRSYALIAQIYHRWGRLSEALTAYAPAIAALDAARQRQRDNTDEDTLLEDPQTLELWQNWLRYLLQTAGATEANEQAIRADWPPLTDWLKTFADSSVDESADSFADSHIALGAQLDKDGEADA